jgi:excinuclease ABC subunit A
VDRILALPEGTRLYLLAPVVRGRKGEYRKDLADYLKKGFQRAKIDGAFHELSAAPALDKKLKHDIDIVVDRVVVRPEIASRLADSLETALGIADGIAVAEFADRPLKVSPPSLWGRDGEGEGEGESATPPLAPPHKEEGKSAANAGAARGEQPSAKREEKDVLRNKNETHERIVFSEKFACPVSGFTIQPVRRLPGLRRARHPPGD